MPRYAYACTICGHAFDIHQSFSDDALTVCPECGGVLRKRYDSIGVTFNGGGFYRTDSRSDSRSDAGATKTTPPASTGAAAPAKAATE